MSQLDNETPPTTTTTKPRGMIRRGLNVIGGTIAAFFVIFIPTFFGGASGFEQDHVSWWAWPAVLVAVAICVAFAWSVRRRNPSAAGGAMIGVALGLLLAGICFTGM